MVIQGAEVFGEDKRFVRRDLFIENGRFCAAAGGETLDAGGLLAVPGLIDLHFHGCAGRDLCDADAGALAAMADCAARAGVTAICPATMSLGEAALTRVCAAAAAARGGLRGAALVGLHLEGPFLSPEKRGAHDPAQLCLPDPDLFDRLQAAAGGLIRICDLAPELAGADALIDRLRGRVVLSIAHSAADYDTAGAAIRRGVTHVTHLFNGMPPFTHRSPGILGAAMDGGCEVELIADGVHLHPTAVRLAFRLFGERVILISDSMRAAGMPDGCYTLGGQRVWVESGAARLADGTLAGSVRSLADCVRIAVREMGIPLADALWAATAAPAKSLGLFSERGSIAIGKIADLLLLDRSLSLRAVILRGARYV